MATQTDKLAHCFILLRQNKSKKNRQNPTLPGAIKLTKGLGARLYWNKVSLILALQRKGLIAVTGSRHKKTVNSQDAKVH